MIARPSEASIMWLPSYLWGRRASAYLIRLWKASWFNFDKRDT